jgi:hypothetical protein
MVYSYVTALHTLLLERAGMPINKRSANALANMTSAALIAEENPQPLRRLLVAMLRACESVNAMPVGNVVWPARAATAQAELLAYLSAQAAKAA